MAAETLWRRRLNTFTVGSSGCGSVRVSRDAHQVVAHGSSKRRANAYRQASKTIAEYCANVNTNLLFGDRCGKLCITKITSP
jgi:hypothetical protein